MEEVVEEGAVEAELRGVSGSVERDGWMGG